MRNQIWDYVSKQLVAIPRSGKQGLMLAADCLLLMFAAWAAYSLRLGTAFEPSLKQWPLILAAPLLAIPVFVRFGLYRSVIRYLGEQALWAVFKAMSLAALLWAVLAFMTQMTGIAGVPRSIPVLYWLLGMVLTGGLRFAARWALWIPVRSRYSGRQVLIYGAGNAGRQLAASLRRGNDLFPAGFLDDNSALRGRDLDGLRIYPPEQLPVLMQRFDIQDVIVTLPSVSSSRRQEVLAFLKQYPVKVRILPAMTDIANGRHLVNMVREVDIGDLLGRDPVPPSPELLGRCISEKVVMVTGAGGSIGSELCQQIAAIGPARIILVEISEHALYQVDRALRRIARCEVIPYLGSVRDSQLMASLLSTHGVHTVYHAAAYKHVPLVESNVIEAARNNVLGTLVTAQAAFETGVETFVLISTDKAVRPTSVMGATKRWAELVVHDLARQAHAAGRRQRFCAVRFGNVLGSSGSVIPLFKEQIAQGGPVTVTDAEVTRYFMSVHEAVQLVIQAGSMATEGEIYLLDMGEPIKIIDLARNMIRLAGLSIRDEDHQDGDIEITFTGLRPGEKLYEELLISIGNNINTAHPKIMMAREPGLESIHVTEALKNLNELMKTGDVKALQNILLDIANEKRPTSVHNAIA